MTRPSRFALWVCRWFGHDLFGSHCTRCGYDKPFVVGKVRTFSADANEVPR